MTLERLGYEAAEGEFYCSMQDTAIVDDPEEDPDWDGTDFFDLEEDEE